MEDVEKLIRSSLEEIERLLTSKTVVGEPMIIEGNTIVPLIRIGFGFGAAGGSGAGGKSAKGEGSGGGAAGAAWIRPTAVIVVGKDGVKVESIKGTVSSVVEKAGEIIVEAVEKRGRKEEK